MNFSSLIYPSMICSCVALILGCQGDPTNPSYLREKPADDEVIGVWSLDLDGSTVPDLPRVGFDGATIRLVKGGSFSVSNMPDCFNFSNYAPQGHLENGGGKWRVKQVQDFWTVELDFTRGGNRVDGGTMNAVNNVHTPPKMTSKTNSNAARLASVSEPTVDRYVALYRERGIEGLKKLEPLLDSARSGKGHLFFVDAAHFAPASFLAA